MAKHNKQPHPALQKALFAKAVIAPIPANHRLSDIYDFLKSDNPFTHTLDTNNNDRVANMAGVLYAETEWLKYKQIYKCRHDIMQALLDSDDMNFNLADLNIPFPAMYFDISAMGFDISIDMPGKFTGVFVAVTPDDDENHSIAISFLHESTIHNFAGLLIDYKQDRTVADILNGVIAETTKLGEFRQLDAVKAATKLTFMLMAYVSSYEPDVKENKPQVVLIPTGRGKNIPVQIRTWDVGTRYIIEKPRQEPSDIIIKSDGSHSSPRPHVRRGHWHTYRVGKGRTKTIVRWLAPMYIGNPENNPVVIREKN